jgi:preprotein translocase subunit SecE
MSQDDLSGEESAVFEQNEETAFPGRKIRRYVYGVRMEMRQVSWPTWNQVRSTTFVVIFFAVAMAAFMGLVSGICELLYRLVGGR